MPERLIPYDPDDLVTDEARLLFEIRELLVEIQDLLAQRLRRTV